MKVEYRSEECQCPKCNKPALLVWVYEDGQCKGYDSSPDYVVIADAVFHTSCWNILVEEHPP